MDDPLSEISDKIRPTIFIRRNKSETRNADISKDYSYTKITRSRLHGMTLKVLKFSSKSITIVLGLFLCNFC